MKLAEVPLEIREEVAIRLVTHGADPLLMLAATVWPVGEGTGEIDEMQFCVRGHPLDEENLYLRPNSGWRKCRACDREVRRSRAKAEKRREKVPCTFCGQPCCRPGDNHGTQTPRCRKCFLKQRRSRSDARFATA